MPSQGFNLASSAVNDASAGTDIWTNPTQALTDNTIAAYASTDLSNRQTNYLKITNFGFSIPGGATIDGIEVTVKRQNWGNIGTIVDQEIKLVHPSGGIGGANKALAVNWSGVSWETVTYGGAADLWGLSWTDADINSANFGFALRAIMSGSGGSYATAYVDVVKIKVYYTDAVGNSFFQMF